MLDFYYDPIVIKAGSIVCFDEIYKSEISVGKLAKLVIQKEQEWKRQIENLKDLRSVC